MYQPRIRADRIHDLHEVKIFTRKPMTVILDEALSIYLANFMTSPEYTAWCEQTERRMEEDRDREPEDFNDNDWLG